jgi:hypothetical protein
MTVNEFVSDLRLDLCDPQGELLSDPSLKRCVRKAVFRVGLDLNISFAIASGQISPEPDTATKNLIAILAQIYACQLMRAATANAFSFSSADKRVDKSGQPAQWAKLEEDLTTQYTQALKALRPNATVGEDTYILTPSSLWPVIYEQGVELDDFE